MIQDNDGDSSDEDDDDDEENYISPDESSLPVAKPPMENQLDSLLLKASGNASAVSHSKNSSKHDKEKLVT